MRRRTALLLLGAAVLLAACGSSPSAPSAATTTGGVSAVDERPPPPKLGPLTVTTPRSGRLLRAHAVGAQLYATLDVSGRADPRQTLYTQASCSRSSCQRLAASNAHGRWTTRSLVVVPIDAPQLSITVGYTDPASGQDPQTLHVTLRAAHDTTPVSDHTPVPPHVPLPPLHSPTPTPIVTTPATTGGTPAAVVPATPATGSGRPLVMIGDSLAVGTRDALAADLPGWGVTTSARTGRPLSEGMAILARTKVSDPRTILAFSLFTNDAPTNTAALRSAVLSSLGKLGDHGCAIWATIQRPPWGGTGYAAANGVLRDLATTPGLQGRLLIVPWSQQVRAHPEWMAGDHVHATGAGYAARAQMYANAARSCTA